jgi:hypothetical protein
MSINSFFNTSGCSYKTFVSEVDDTFSSVKEQAFDFMWDGINWKKGVNILLTNNR